MRWRALGIAVVLVLASACGDDDDVVGNASDASATTTTTAPDVDPPRPSGPPSILVANGSSVVRVDGDAVSHVGDVEGTAAMAYGDGEGAVAVEVDGTLVALLDGDPMQLDPGAPGEVFLYDVEQIDGVPHVLYGVLDAREGVERTGPLILASMTGGERRELGSAFAVEFTTITGSIGGELLATSAYSDLTESVDIGPLDFTGEANPWSPTTGLAYNEPPLIGWAMLAPDASTIAWLSGPDPSGASGDGSTMVGSWEVVVADLDGAELHRLPLDGAPAPVHLDYDGNRLLVSREGATALVIDLSTAEQHELPVPGTATFDE